MTQDNSALREDASPLPLPASTPGPWRMHDMEANTVVGLDHLAIADFNATGRTAATNAANSQLGLAAPDLLAASTAQAVLIEGAQAILTQYLIPDGINANEAISRLLAHFDGPNQRRVKALHEDATERATA